MRVSTVVLALGCLLTGFALAGTRVKALEDVSSARFPSGFTVGTRVQMSFDAQSRVFCTIERIDAGWVKCADEMDGFNKEPHPAWYAIAHVTDVERLQPKQ